MGTSISLWVERRQPSGAWAIVKRSATHEPAWRQAADPESSASRGKDFAQRMLQQMSALPVAIPARVRELLERAQVQGFTGGGSTWELGKNYNLFAILADHRNRQRDGTRFTEHVIAQPRGFPLDMSDEVLEDATRDFFDADARPSRAKRLQVLERDVVAPSWVTLAEVLAVDWDAATHGGGVVGEAGDFLTLLHEELVPLGPPDDVRLVFYFDC
jgi:hypothetical protein